MLLSVNKRIAALCLAGASVLALAVLPRVMPLEDPAARGAPLEERDPRALPERRRLRWRRLRGRGRVACVLRRPRDGPRPGPRRVPGGAAAAADRIRPDSGSGAVARAPALRPRPHGRRR